MHDARVANLLVAGRQFVVGQADEPGVARELRILERAGVQGDRAGLFTPREGELAVEAPEHRELRVRERFAQGVRRTPQDGGRLRQVVLQQVPLQPWSSGRRFRPPWRGRRTGREVSGSGRPRRRGPARGPRARAPARPGRSWARGQYTKYAHERRDYNSRDDLRGMRATHRGRRPTNEDALLIDLEAGLFVVAKDGGMGGHQCRRSRRRPRHRGRGPGGSRRRSRPDGIAARGGHPAGQRRHLRGRAPKRSGCAGMGTTVVAALATAGGFAVAGVGDSRVYRLGDGHLAVDRR